MQYLPIHQKGGDGCVILQIMLLLECSPAGNHRLGLHSDGRAGCLLTWSSHRRCLCSHSRSLRAARRSSLLLYFFRPILADHVIMTVWCDMYVCWQWLGYCRRLVEVAVEILKIRDPAPMLGKSQSWACADDVIFRRLPTRVWKHRPCIPGIPGRWQSIQQSTYFEKPASLSDFLCKWCVNVVLGDVLTYWVFWVCNFIPKFEQSTFKMISVTWWETLLWWLVNT